MRSVVNDNDGREGMCLNTGCVAGQGSEIVVAGRGTFAGIGAGQVLLIGSNSDGHI